MGTSRRNRSFTLLTIHNISAILIVQMGIASSVACNSLFSSTSESENITIATNETTFRVCDKTPEKHAYFDRLNSSNHQEQIMWLPQYRGNKCTEILQSSNFPEKSYFYENGFVKTVVEAYNKHHKLVIRPDDVWGAIMTQFSFYINKHSEEFRGKFVNFEGKKTLEVTVPGSLRSAPYDTLVKLMSDEIHKNLVDPQVKNWILPSFSTTTDNDLVTIGVVFMATMKKYFDYKFGLACGIPWVTLAGTVEDWENIHGRLEKLKEYKLDKWYHMLEPILQQFVNAKKGEPDLDFWGKIAHYERGGSGPNYISGWITAFCVFDKDGDWTKSREFRESDYPFYGSRRPPPPPSQWLRIDTDDIPAGIVEVDVIINDNGREYNSVMFAGHVAEEIKSDGYTVQPTLGWIMALKPDNASTTTALPKRN